MTNKTNRLTQGDMAPDFAVTALDGAPIALGDYRGRRVLLSFYRYASCPLCNLRVHTLRQHHAGWQTRGLDLLAVFQSPAERLTRYVGTQAPPFPLIPDPAQRLYAQYGVGHSWQGFLAAWMGRLPEIGRAVLRRGFLPGTVEGGIHRIPADFIIDEQGRVLRAYYGQDIGDHLPLGEIEALLPAG